MNSPFRIVVIGASAGGVDALKAVVGKFPADFPAAICVVIHIPAQGPSLLADILNTYGTLPAIAAVDGTMIQAGHVYVAVSDRHLLFDGGVLRLSRGPKENRFRPAIDAMFRSAAYNYGPRVVGVILTGQLDDGTAGLWAIKDRGGLTIVQSPQDAQYPSMPMSALQDVDIDHVVDLHELPQLLSRLAREPLPSQPMRQVDAMRTENDIAAGKDPLRAGSLQLGNSTHITCPECHGVLSKVHEGSIVRFRCHTGHAYSVKALLADIDESIDASLWGAFRTVQEHSLLLREAALLARDRDNAFAADVFERRASDCEDKGEVIRNLLREQSTDAPVAM